MRRYIKRRINSRTIMKEFEFVNSAVDGQRSLNDLDVFGWAAIHVAVRHGWIQLLKNLIKKSKKQLKLLTSKRESALFIGIVYKQFESVKVLLDMGAPPNYGGKKCFSPLHSATDNLDKTYLELLLKSGANVNCNNGDVTALEHACKNENVEAVKILLDNGAHVCVPSYNKSFSIIEEAIHNDQLTKLLLDKIKIKDLNAFNKFVSNKKQEKKIPMNRNLNKFWNAFIHYSHDQSTYDKHLEIPRFTSILHYAANHGNFESFKMLYPKLKNDLKTRCCEIKDNEMYSTCLLHSAIYSSELRADTYDIMEFLLKQNQNPNECATPHRVLLNSFLIGRHGERPRSMLTWVVRPTAAVCYDFMDMYYSVLGVAIIKTHAHHKKLVQCLLLNGAEVNPTFDKVVHPLALAMYKGSQCLFDMLMSCGANSNYCTKVDDHKIPVLFIAACMTRGPFLFKLLKAGADPTLCPKPLWKQIKNFSRSSHWIQTLVDVFTGKSSIACKTPELEEKYNRAANDNKRQTLAIDNFKFVVNRDEMFVCGDGILSLMHMCRVVIVHQIQAANNHGFYENFVNMLPLPRKLQDYLKYSLDINVLIK